MGHVKSGKYQKTFNDLLLWPVIHFFTSNLIKKQKKKKLTMLEQLDKRYIPLIGLYMPIGETSLYKVDFPSKWAISEQEGVLCKESQFVITGYLWG